MSKPKVNLLDIEFANKVIVNDNASIPCDLRSRESIEVIYTAGYGDAASDVPFDIKQAIYMYAQSIYDFNRAADQLIAEAYTMPEGCKQLLNPYVLQIGLNG